MRCSFPMLLFLCTFLKFFSATCAMPSWFTSPSASSLGCSSLSTSTFSVSCNMYFSHWVEADVVVAAIPANWLRTVFGCRRLKPWCMLNLESLARAFRWNALFSRTFRRPVSGTISSACSVSGSVSSASSCFLRSLTPLATVLFCCGIGGYFTTLLEGIVSFFVFVII